MSTMTERYKGLRSLSDIRPLYILPNDPFAEEGLIPGFQNADRVDCMAGFFSSEILSDLAPGLATYINATENSFRLIISPLLRPEDQAAIEEGVKTAEAMAKEILAELIITENLLQQHTLECLSWLLCTGRIEIKIALMKDALFHPKVWLFHEGDDVMAVHGSSNVTHAGIKKNIEQIAISKSWDDPNQRYITETLCYQFGRLWENREDGCVVVALPEATRKRIIQTYRTDTAPTEVDLRDLYVRATSVSEESASYDVRAVPSVSPARLELPDGLNIHSGPFAHQGKAMSKWEIAGRKGILAMATGSGKTITALAAAARIQDEGEALMVVISAPYRPLVAQWMDEVESFGVKAVPLKGTARERTNRLDLAVRGLATGIFKIQVAVVTENYLATSEFRTLLDAIPVHIKTLLIADEVHNLGSRSFISNPPNRFDYRLGLSATPERQYDPEGTRALFDFFGAKVFEYSLAEAIGICLVPYNYYIHRVYLTEDEFEEWQQITARLVRAGFNGEDQDPNESGKLSTEVQALLNKRRKVIEAAENKCLVLKKLLRAKPREEIRHTLIYATDKDRDQLRSINNMLQNDLNLTIHQLTAEETQSKKRTSYLLDRFAKGEFQIITCMRVLDEGVDVPQVNAAYLLASNTVKRQWIQRRGRVLRRCETINKKVAHLHDFVVIPPDPTDSGGRSILKAELDRAQEFAELANNSGVKDGPFDEIEKIMSEIYSS